MPLNQIHIVPGDEYHCAPCSRYFNNEAALLQHCKNASIHTSTWCSRCEVLFVDSHAKQDHERHSSNHNVCDVPGCHIDFLRKSDYHEHYEAAHDGCWRCKTYDVMDIGSHEITQHNLCNNCGRFFSTENDLRMHKQVHDSRDIECYGCNRRFASHSGILIHLESGTCPSGVCNDDIMDTAFDYHKADTYTNDPDDYYPLRCPTCGVNFRFVSGLFQHVETKACHMGYRGIVGGLREEIERSVDCQ